VKNVLFQKFCRHFPDLDFATMHIWEEDVFLIFVGVVIRVESRGVEQGIIGNEEDNDATAFVVSWDKFWSRKQDLGVWIWSPGGWGATYPSLCHLDGGGIEVYTGSNGEALKRGHTEEKTRDSIESPRTLGGLVAAPTPKSSWTRLFTALNWSQSSKRL
jgi:hypothetical protein